MSSGLLALTLLGTAWAQDIWGTVEPEPDPVEEAERRIEELRAQLAESDAHAEDLAAHLRSALEESERIHAELQALQLELDDLLRQREEAEAVARGAVVEPVVEPPVEPVVADRPVGYAESIADELGDLLGDSLSDAVTVSFLHGGFVGAQVGAALGYGLDGDAETAVLGGLAGGGLYAIGGALGATATELSLERAAAAHNSAMILGWAGYEVGRIAVASPAHEGKRILAFGALGGLAGSGAGLAAGSLPVEPTTWYGTSLGTAAGWSIGAGTASLLGHEEHERRPRAALGLGVGAGVGAASFTAHHLGQPLPPPGLATLNMAQGTWVGGWAPFVALEQPGYGQRTGGMLVGLGGGYLVAAATSPLFDTDAKLLGLQGLGFAAGSAIGAGIPLSTGIEGHPRGMVLPMLIGGVGGHVGGSLLAPSYQLNKADAYFLPLLQGWAVYQTIGWIIYGDQATDQRQAAGFGLTAAGVGTAAAWTVPAVVDLSPPQTVLAFSGSLWGTWYGAWGAYLAQVQAGRRLAPTLVAGNVGLLGAALPEALGWRPSWAQVGVINGGGALGAGLGALVGVLASPDAATIGTASLIGTTAGFVGGGLAASRMDDGEAADTAALILPQPAWRARLPFRASWTAAPWQDDDGGVGAWVQADLTRRAR